MVVFHLRTLHSKINRNKYNIIMSFKNRFLRRYVEVIIQQYNIVCDLYRYKDSATIEKFVAYVFFIFKFLRCELFEKKETFEYYYCTSLLRDVIIFIMTSKYLYNK